MIVQADILKWAKEYDGPKFHALLCDPPYHLTNRVVDWAGFSDPSQGGRGTPVLTRANERGFMNAKWDGGDIAFRPETWAAITAHLYPGAWGMAFAGSRGWHRMAVAIEDAGLIMQPTIFGWSYGSGFPKATRIDTQIDAAAFRAWLKLHPVEQAALQAARLAERAARKARDARAAKEAKAHLTALSVAYKAMAGLEPRVIGTAADFARDGAKRNANKHGDTRKVTGFAGDTEHGWDRFVTEAATDAARYWIGHRYGGQCLKPALEPIIVFQKPYEGSPLSCITSTGAGALWIDGGRVGAGNTMRSNRVASSYMTQSIGQEQPIGDEYITGSDAGRWPANFILSHSPSCNGTCAPGCPVAALGAQSGESRSSGGPSGRMGGDGIYSDFKQIARANEGGLGDTGTAARFFFQADYMAERIELADAIQYVAKSSRAEREAGLDPRQTAIMRLLDDEDYPDFDGTDDGHAVYGDFQGTPEHGSNMGSRRIDFDATTVDDGRQTPIDNPYQRGETVRRNSHPTIKPISLTRYLATLLLPPPEYGPRRLLIPFSGAGSEIIGADLAGWEEVTGVELEADHVAIARARRAYWQQRRWELGDPARKLTVKAAPKVQQGQVDMFESEAA